MTPLEIGAILFGVVIALAIIVFWVEWLAIGRRSEVRWREMEQRHEAMCADFAELRREVEVELADD